MKGNLGKHFITELKYNQHFQALPITRHRGLLRSPFVPSPQHWDFLNFHTATPTIFPEENLNSFLQLGNENCFHVFLLEPLGMGPQLDIIVKGCILGELTVRGLWDYHFELFPSRSTWMPSSYGLCCLILSLKEWKMNGVG